MNKQEALSQTDKLSDRLGLGIDPEIREPVAALIMLGIETTSSCQGHRRRGLSFPWIGVRADDETRDFIEKHLPEFHFVRQGAPRFSAWKLVPRPVLDITHHPPGKWNRERAALQRFADDVFSGKIVRK